MIVKESTLRLPPFFPLVVRDCQEASTKLFRCLNDTTKELEEKELHVAESLTLCSAEISEYTKCMEAYYTEEERKRNRKKIFGIF
mmetsp:Transcript_33017/g.51625  ORF Transcript_33017/g.51625 Transcript_33017/m.51625 type:complete len:85 (+) Transcript_33017:28-282(+)